MKLDITFPKKVSCNKARRKTKEFFSVKKFYNLFEDPEKRYYIFIRKYGLQVDIITLDQSVQEELMEYFNYIFVGLYIGVQANKDFFSATKKFEVYEIK